MNRLYRPCRARPNEKTGQRRRIVFNGRQMSAPTLDFRNTNSLWCSVVVETLVRLGLRHAVLSPGSRSAPLTFAFARHAGLEAIPVLDERSAAFFALGLARQHHRPTALVCTSGTAAGNYLPAIIEAQESGVPLLVFTADRPPEMRACAAGQAIDQQKLYGGHVNDYRELAVPEATMEMLRYVRQAVIQAFVRTQFPSAGPVHLNAPFRDPLAPVEDGLAEKLRPALDAETFYRHLEPGAVAGTPDVAQPAADRNAGQGPAPLSAAVDARLPLLQVLPSGRIGEPSSEGAVAGRQAPALHNFRTSRGVIVAGPAQPADPAAYCAAVAKLAAATGWPVLADGLSPLRSSPVGNRLLVANASAVLRSPRLAERLKPELVVSLGDWPASKQLRSWLQRLDVETWVIAGDARNHDAVHGRTRHWRGPVEALAAEFADWPGGTGVAPVIPHAMGETSMPAEPVAMQRGLRATTAYAADWLAADQAAGEAIDRLLSTVDFPFEGEVSWLLSQHLPPGTPVFVANSMSVRNVDFFWKPAPSSCAVFFNRGANGIDGTLSTALGIAHENRPAVLLTGDLALLHDTNGFLLAPRVRGSLTIVLINNRGGGIFEMLPVAKFDPPFEEYFATPQDVDFGRLCSAYGAAHVVVRDWAHCTELISALPEKGLRVIEVRTDRRRDAALCREFLGAAAQAAEATGG